MAHTKIARVAAGTAVILTLIGGAAQVALADVNVASLTGGPGRAVEPQNVAVLTGGGGEIAGPVNVAVLTGGGGVTESTRTPIRVLIGREPHEGSSRGFVNMAALTAGGTPQPINVASLTGGGGRVAPSTPARVIAERSQPGWILVLLVAVLLVALGMMLQRRRNKLAMA